MPFEWIIHRRATLQQWSTNIGEQKLEEYRKKNNSISMDGIVTPIGESVTKFNDSI